MQQNELLVRFCWNRRGGSYKALPVTIISRKLTDSVTSNKKEVNRELSLTTFAYQKLLWIAYLCSLDNNGVRCSLFVRVTSNLGDTKVDEMKCAFRVTKDSRPKHT